MLGIYLIKIFRSRAPSLLYDRFLSNFMSIGTTCFKVIFVLWPSCLMNVACFMESDCVSARVDDRKSQVIRRNKTRAVTITERKKGGLA